MSEAAFWLVIIPAVAFALFLSVVCGVELGRYRD